MTLSTSKAETVHISQTFKILRDEGLIRNNTINHLNCILHGHSTVFIVSFDYTDGLHGVTWEHNATLSDHFAGTFVCENVACVFDVVVTL